MHYKMRKRNRFEAQLNVIRETARYLVDIIEEGYNLVITHGNGPQVGRIIIQNELTKDITPAMPFDVCGANESRYVRLSYTTGYR